MRHPIMTSSRAILIAAVLGVGVTAGGIAIMVLNPLGKLAHSRTQLPSTDLELEAELQRQATPAPRSDSVIEDEASRPIQTVVEVERGDTLMDLLTRAGVEKTEATQAISALRDVYNPRALKVGQEVTITFDRPANGIGAGAFNAVLLPSEAGRQVSANRARGGFSVTEVKREVTRQVVRCTGTIKGSLFETATRQGLPAPVLVEMIRAYSYDVDFQRDIQPGDRFEVMFERYIDKKGQPVRDGNILYANLELSGSPMPIYRYADANGQADYYNPKGESLKKALLRTPVDGARITSGFGMRMHPILGYSQMHKGIDFAVTTGTPVMAAGAGVIDYAGANGAYGYYVRIKHDATHSTAYAHLSRFAQGIRVGRRVAQGQTVAYSGSTGRSTGPHLHYEILVNNAQVNPMSVKFQAGTKLAGADLNHFLNDVRQANALVAQTPVSSRVALAKRDNENQN